MAPGFAKYRFIGSRYWTLQICLQALPSPCGIPECVISTLVPPAIGSKVISTWESLAPLGKSRVLQVIAIRLPVTR